MKMKSAYFCISAKTRKYLYIGVNVASVVSTVLCALYLGLVLFSLHRHRFLLHDLIISLFDDLYKNLVSLGVLLIFLSILSFKLNQNLKNQPTNHSLPRTHRVWVGLLILSLLATAVCATLMTRVQSVVNDEVGPRLKHGLSLYMEAPSWGSALDRIQSYLRCCGVHGPADWYATAWIPLDRLAGHDVDYKLVQPTGRVQAPVVPSSCCRAAGAECGHRALLEAKSRSWADLRPVDASLLHSAGCAAAVTDTLARDLLHFRAILLVVFVLQVGLVLAARLLYSSTVNSVLLGRPRDAAPGWLVGPRLLLGKERKGNLQDYDDRCQSVEHGDESTSSHKTKWRCLNKMRRRRKSNDESDTEDTQFERGKKRRFKSPCMAKLKSPKCVTKLKASYSKKFRKQKNKEDVYTALESESDLSPERGGGGLTGQESDLNQEGEERERLSEAGRKQSPERMKAGGNERQYISSTSTERSAMIKSRVRRKISGNLMDVENVVEEQSKFEIFEVDTNQNFPFSPKYSRTERNLAKSPYSDKKGMTTETKNVLEPRKEVSVIVEDFKKRRELFENAAKPKSKTGSEGDTVQIPMPHPIQDSFNLIDLDAVENSKSSSMIGTSCSALTSLSSTKHDAKPLPTTLRNYPPLSPFESTVKISSETKM